MALLGTLVDNFCSATLDTATWNAANSAGNSGTQAGCQYTFIVTAGATGDATLTSDVTYNLTGSHIHVELIDAGVQEVGLETYPIILTEAAANQDDALFIVVSNGVVGLYEEVGGVPNGLAFPSYNAVTMRWWRIREAAGTVYFESASNVRGPWTVQASVVPTVNVAALYAKIRTFAYIALATAKQTAVSNVNYLAPPDVPFPNGALEVGMELAFGADIDGDQNDWVWTNVTPPDGQSVFMSQDVTVTRGRADESSDVTPTAANLELDNPAGDFTPDNAASIYYPNVDLGTPARWWLYASTPRLYLRPAYGSNAKVASISSLDITADLDVRVDMHMKTTHPAGQNAVVAGRANNGGNYSWRLEVQPDRTVTLFWSDTGTLPANQETSTVPVVPMSARATLRVTLDVDNGAGGYDVKFYIGTGGVNGSFSQVGPTITGGSPTSISNVSEPLIVGCPPDVTDLLALDADVYHFQLRDGIGGTQIADADFTAQVSGVSMFVDSVGLLWTVNGAAELSNRWFRITGTVDSWEPKWPWGDLSNSQPGGLTEGQARTELEIAGILRRLGQGASPLDSPLRRALSRSALVQAYWPMEDGTESSQFATGIIGGSPLTTSGVIDFAAEDSLFGSKPLPTLSATSGWSGAVTGTFTGAWQADFYVLVPTGPGSPTTIINVTATPGATVALWVVNISAGAITVQGRNALNVTITTNTTAPTGFFGVWQHVRLMVQQNAANVDWQLVWFPVTIPPSSGFFFTGSVAGTIGGVAMVSLSAAAGLAGISMGHMSIINQFNISLTDGAAIGWAGDTAADRMIRLCDEEGISFRIIGEASTTAQVGIQQAATLLTLLDEAHDADGGILYEMLDSVGLIYRTRESLYNQPPNMVLDGLTPSSDIANPFTPIKDDQRVRNDVTITRTGGSSYEAVDQASVDKLGIYDDAITLNLYTDSQLQSAAGWRLHQGTVPGMRYPSLKTNLGVATQAAMDAWLTVDEGAQVWATNLPPQHPTGTVRVIAEGYSEPISPFTWEPAMNCSPASVWDVTELDGDWVSDQYLLRLETDGSELALPVDSDDTTLIVTVTEGPDWTDDNAECPMDINISGEQITVTDITAASGGEGFTGAGDAEETTPTVSFVAPSVVAPAIGDLLICAWCSNTVVDTYTLPGGMTLAATTDGTYSTLEDATEVLGASGATGTRTATFGTADTWSAVSVVAHSATGTPGIQELLDGVDTDAGGASLPVTLTTLLAATTSDWLFAIQGWDWDPGGNMGSPSGTGWIAVADSTIIGTATSRVRAWARRVTVAGIQSVTFETVAGISDNHARLYVLTDVTSITQTFTVTRSVNGIVKSHDAGADITLWYTPVLAR